MQPPSRTRKGREGSLTKIYLLAAALIGAKNGNKDRLLYLFAVFI
jgi:hypothetical protein